MPSVTKSQEVLHEHLKPSANANLKQHQNLPDIHQHHLLLVVPTIAGVAHRVRASITVPTTRTG